MLNTTVGQLLVNDSLPPALRDYDRVLDGKQIKSLLQQVAREYPDQYRDVSFKLNQIGQKAAQEQGGMSFGIRHLKKSKSAVALRKKLQAAISRAVDDDTLTDKSRAEKIVRVVGKEMDPQIKAVLAEAIEDKNPLALQVLSGSRGKPMNLASLLGSDLLYSDHRDEVIPIPVLRSYSEGLSPEEYWAGTYGARRGIIATKFATQEAGFLSKQLNQAGHRLVVVDDDFDDGNLRGIVVDTDDADNEGSLLATDVGPYKKNTPLTPKILGHLKRLGKSRILVRSPLVGGSPDGGVYAKDVGIRENGTLPGRGEQVGLQAAQALSEPISQGQLSAKHSGGVAGQEKAVSGFQYINQLIQVPKRMQGGAAHSEVDGKVQRIEPAPAGGSYVVIGDKQHFVNPGFKLKHKVGDEVEAGDVISDGIPNPALIVRHKGVGAGRRYFVEEFRKAMASGGMRGHRRNIELLARGLINHVKLTDETDSHAPDDIVPYSTLEHTYKPREGHQLLVPKKAVGQYLERPVLHYTIGTKIRPSMLKDFEEFGIRELQTHKDPPPFEPHMVRGMYQLQHDPDWMTQMYGSGLKKSLLNSVATGAKSEERGTSFVPSLAATTDFGEDSRRAVIKPLKPSNQIKFSNDSQNYFFGGRYKVAVQTKAQGTDTRTGTQVKPISPNSSVPASNPAAASSSAGLPSQQNNVPLNSNIMPNQGSGVPGTFYSAPPATPAQARADNIQQQRGNNLLSNPAFLTSLKHQNPMQQLAILLAAADPDAASKLMPTKLKSRSLSDAESVSKIIEDSSSIQESTNEDISDFSLRDTAAGMSGEIAKLNNATNAVKAIRAGETVGDATKAITSAKTVDTINDTAKTVVKPLTTALDAAEKVPVVKHLVPSVKTVDTAVDAAGAAKGVSTAAKGVSKVLGPAAVALEGALVANDVYNKGWDQTTNDTGQKVRDLFFKWDDGVHEIYKKPWEAAVQFFSPIENSQMILGGMSQLGGAAYDIGKATSDSISSWWRGDEGLIRKNREPTPQNSGGGW